ncbi:MAG: hypothetical protein QGG24_10270 [Vicinamibacterales bacterium]|nr:hypothetical protein [Vicinamibacterales bacterium]MDP7670584.1 hypothetical protein [Vicinamibacterales bacterium]HJO39132.1 hypothetical protein [Vicinamibacterales bacterium]
MIQHWHPWHRGGDGCDHMLTAATLGLAGYGLYSTVYGLVDLFRPESLEVWADLTLVVFGLVLAMSAPLVRVAIPGGLALAIGTLLGLEAIAIHNVTHDYGRVVAAPLVIRGVFSAVLVGLAWMGERQEAGDSR